MINLKYLHSHDASAPVIRNVSTDFNVVVTPSNDGIISVISPTEIPPMKSMRFFISVASTCEIINC